MPYKIEGGIWSSVFAVPTAVVDRHLKLCSPLSVKILLLLLRHPEQPADTGWIASQLCLPAAEIADALNYWIGVGIVTESDSQSAADAPPSSLSPPLPPSQPSARAFVDAKQDTQTGQTIVTVSARPKMARADLSELTQADPSLAHLLQEAQQLLGAPLTPVESEILTALRSYYKLDSDAILLLLQYCVSIGKASMQYLEKIAAAWCELGISSYERVEQEIVRLTQNNEQEKFILSTFRIQGRGLSAREKEFVSRWFALELDHALLALACEATLDKTGKVSFAYADKILVSWKSRQIFTLAAATEDLKKNSAPVWQKTAPQNKSARTAGSSINKDELRDLIRKQFMDNAE